MYFAHCFYSDSVIVYTDRAIIKRDFAATKADLAQIKADLAEIKADFAEISRWRYNCVAAEIQLCFGRNTTVTRWRYLREVAIKFHESALRFHEVTLKSRESGLRFHGITLKITKKTFFIWMVIKKLLLLHPDESCI